MSVFRRAIALARRGHTIEILVDSFSPGFDDTALALQLGIFEGNKVTLRSMYGDLAGTCHSYDSSIAYSSPLGPPEEGWTYKQDLKRLGVWRGCQNGVYKQFVWMRGLKVNGIDSPSNGIRLNGTIYLAT